MRNQWDYWSAWVAGWSMAARTIFDMQQRMLEQFLAASRLPMEQRRGAGLDIRTPGVEARGQVEVAPPATAGDKPRRRRPSAGAPPQGRGRASRGKAVRRRGD